MSPSNHRLEREQALTGQLGGQNPAEPHRHMLTKMHAIHTHTHTLTLTHTHTHTHTHTQPSRYQKPWCVKKLSSPPDVLAAKLRNHQDFLKTT